MCSLSAAKLHYLLVISPVTLIPHRDKYSTQSHTHTHTQTHRKCVILKKMRKKKKKESSSARKCVCVCSHMCARQYGLISSSLICIWLAQTKHYLALPCIYEIHNHICWSKPYVRHILSVCFRVHFVVTSVRFWIYSHSQPFRCFRSLSCTSTVGSSVDGHDIRFCQHKPSCITLCVLLNPVPPIKKVRIPIHTIFGYWRQLYCRQ